MKWSAKQVNQLILEMAAQARATSWDSGLAPERARILTEILKRYGWVRRSHHPPEVCNAAVGIAFHAPGTDGHVLRLQVLGCLFAESHCETTMNPGGEGNLRRRWFGLKRQTAQPRPHPDMLADSRIVREQFARLLDKVLGEIRQPIVFGMTKPQLQQGRLVYPVLCCPNDLLWMRCALGVDTSVEGT